MPNSRRQNKLAYLPAQKDRAGQMLLLLADKLDPVNRLAINTKNKTWVEPPDIVDWAHASFFDPIAEDYIKLQPHQMRILRTVFRMIWDKEVVTVVYSDIKKCLGADERITLDDGSWARVGDLVGKTAKVFSFDSSLKKKVKVDAEFTDNGIQPCLKIRTRYGFQYIRTKEHPFLTAFGWKQAKDIVLGDRLLVPMNLTSIGDQEEDENLVKYLAYILGDKSVPDFIFKLNDRLIALFLNRLFSGDGGTQGHRVFYYTTSNQLAKDVQYLLLRLGIVAQLKDHINPACRTGHVYEVIVGDRKQVKLFRNKIGFFHSGKSERLLAIVSETANIKKNRVGDHDVLDSKLWDTVEAERIKQRKEKRDLEINWTRSVSALTRSKCSAASKNLSLRFLEKVSSSAFGFDEITSIENVGEVATVNIETSNNRFVTTVAEHNSGKTTVAGLVGAYWATFVEQPNEIITIANDKEQAQGRIFAAMVPTMEHLNWYVPEKAPTMENKKTGSKIRAISTNYAGEAGGNYGLTLWSELWAMTSENRRRLWEEMTPVPTRQYSIRWVETYAGFLGESELLWNLYSQAFEDGKEEKPLGNRIPGLEDLPIWYMPRSKLVVYWNHVPKMPWQTEEYYSQQRADLRPNAYLRLHQNMWVSSKDIFIDPQDWDLLEECDPLKEEGDKRVLFLGADGSVSGDFTALVAAAWDHELKAPEIVGCWIWEPQKQEGASEGEKKIIDLSETLKTKIAELIDKYDVVAIYYDMYQLHSIMTDLKKVYDKSGIKKMFVNFPQNTGRVESDQAFYQFIKSKKLKTIKHTQLREHVLDAVAEESIRGFRIAKEKTSKKIDACVAASMACYGASSRNRPPRRFISV